VMNGVNIKHYSALLARLWVFVCDWSWAVFTEVIEVTVPATRKSQRGLSSKCCGRCGMYWLVDKQQSAHTSNDSQRWLFPGIIGYLTHFCRQQ